MRKLLFLFIAIVVSAEGFAQPQFTKLFNEFGVEGSVTVYDFNTKKWFYTDSVDAKKMTLPASTFKIINSCIALETNAVTNEKEIVDWDGEEKTFFGTPVPAWNKDSSLEDAFRNSTIWFYEEMADRITKKTYRTYLEKSGYGNGEIWNGQHDFWNYGDFSISPEGQILFLEKLHEETLPFSRRTHQIVKNLMITEVEKDFIIRGKTGWTKKNGKDIGWWTGYIERGENIFFFATRILKNEDDPNPDFSSYRKEITESILNEIGVF